MANIYDRQYGGNCIGRVENNGAVYDRQYGGNCVGHVDGIPIKFGGAAFVLLLR